MKLHLKNVCLRLIDESDIEQLRVWRNDKKIADNMFYQEHITPEMQQQWFHSLSIKHDFYFIIQYKDEAIGLINLSKIDIEKKEGHVGLFIYKEQYWGGPIPVYASLILLHFAFKLQGLKRVWAKVRADNVKARKYNENLGFETKDNEWQYLYLEKYDKTSFSLYLKLLK